MDIKQVATFMDKIQRMGFTRETIMIDGENKNDLYGYYSVNPKAFKNVSLVRDDHRPVPQKNGALDFSYKKRLQEYDEYRQKVNDSQALVDEASDVLNWILEEANTKAEQGVFDVKGLGEGTLLKRLGLVALFFEKSLGLSLSPIKKGQIFAAYMKCFKRAAETKNAYARIGDNRLVYTHDVYFLHGLICEWGFPVCKGDVEVINSFMQEANEKRNSFSTFADTVPENVDKKQWEEKFGVTIDSNYSAEEYDEDENTI